MVSGNEKEEEGCGAERRRSDGHKAKVGTLTSFVPIVSDSLAFREI